MALLVLLSDRAPEAALPALADLRFDVKVDAARGERARSRP